MNWTPTQTHAHNNHPAVFQLIILHFYGFFRMQFATSSNALFFDEWLTASAIVLIGLAMPLVGTKDKVNYSLSIYRRLDQVRYMNIYQYIRYLPMFQSTIYQCSNSSFQMNHLEKIDTKKNLMTNSNFDNRKYNNVGINIL